MNRQIKFLFLLIGFLLIGQKVFLAELILHLSPNLAIFMGPRQRLNFGNGFGVVEKVARAGIPFQFLINLFGRYCSSSLF